MKAVVVGGGCAGLTAAHVLVRNGYEVTVIEKAQHPGGRMTAFKKDGFIVDNAAQLVHPGYKMSRQLMEEIGLLDQLLEADLSGMKIFHDGTWIDPRPSENDRQEMEKTAAWINQMGKESFERFCDWVVSRCRDSMYEGSTDWLLDVDLSGNFESLVRKEFGEGVLECLVQPIIATLGLTTPDDVGIGFGLQLSWAVLSGKAAVLKYGLGSMAEKMAESLGGKVITSTEVNRIVVTDNQVRGVETDGAFIEADTVICATQANKTLEIAPDLPQVMREALSKVTYCPCIHVMIFVDRVMSGAGMIGGMLPRKTGSDFCGFLFHSACSKSMLPEGKDCISAFIYGQACEKHWKASDREIAKAVVEQLRDVLPQMPQEIRFWQIVRFLEANYTMHSGCATAIKDMRDHHYNEVRGLFLCGEYMYTGSYESAVCSGRRVAEAVMGLRETI